jgi:triacylglycerol lipase
MNSFFSAGFPLNAGYALFRLLKIESDGFTSIDSSKWGNFMGCFETKRIRGVSHGDTIDLMRENIHGFDVCEFYIKIVSDLKGRGL